MLCTLGVWAGSFGVGMCEDGMGVKGFMGLWSELFVGLAVEVCVLIFFVLAGCFLKILVRCCC